VLSFKNRLDIMLCFLCIRSCVGPSLLCRVVWRCNTKWRWGVKSCW